MPERTTTSRRRRRLLRGASATLVLAGVAAYAVVQYDSGSRARPHCESRGADPESETHSLTPAQAANAATIAAVGNSRGLPERAVTIALATAMQESSLRNLDHGHLDSLGLFQQRPSMGWGDEQQVQDPVYAANAFYTKLLEIPAYEELELTVAAQEVQRSAFPDEYAKHEDNATLLSGPLTGRAPASFTCVTDNDPTPADPELLRERLEEVFGGRASVERRGDDDFEWAVTLDRAGGEADGSPGWELSHWLVAQAGVLGVAEVVHDGRHWVSARSDQGWRTAEGGTADSGASGDSGDSGGNSLETVLLSLVPSVE
ncbi:heavy metal transporter [Streptomyces sedi]|uniref:Heavy metal transporter n=1 Tax=Streptomyces sedi TaxID=555059 RepID=A0A5C4VA70_9ACTN|nr:heavy metal transporter [Streptomyces sedi]TNM32808.1 heavy metal transporter [Streptomyces sedi]